MRINVGSGQRKFDTEQGWVNIDIQYKPPDQTPDVLADGCNLPFDDGSIEIEMVVLHHVLEHFGCGEASGLVKECWRVLGEGGSLLVFVPDLRKLAHRWLTGGLDEQIYMTNLYGAYQGNEADRHRWGWSMPALVSYLIETLGIDNAFTFDWREIPGADIARDWWIAGVECKK